MIYSIDNNHYLYNMVNMFRLEFDTKGVYEGAWHECDWKICFGYFSTYEMAELYIEGIFKTFEDLDDKYDFYDKIRSDAMNEFNDEVGIDISITERIKRNRIYETIIKPADEEKAKFNVRREFKVKDHYKIIEIKPSDIDNVFNGDFKKFVSGFYN